MQLALGFKTELLCLTHVCRTVLTHKYINHDYNLNKHQHHPGLTHNLRAKWDKQL